MTEYTVGVPKSSWHAFGEETVALGISSKLLGGSAMANSWFMLYYDIEVDDEETMFYLKLKYGLTDGREDVEKLFSKSGNLTND